MDCCFECERAARESGFAAEFGAEPGRIVRADFQHDDTLRARQLLRARKASATAARPLRQSSATTRAPRHRDRERLP